MICIVDEEEKRQKADRDPLRLPRSRECRVETTAKLWEQRGITWSCCASRAPDSPEIAALASVSRAEARTPSNAGIRKMHPLRPVARTCARLGSGAINRCTADGKTRRHAVRRTLAGSPARLRELRREYCPNSGTSCDGKPPARAPSGGRTSIWSVRRCGASRTPEALALRQNAPDSPCRPLRTCRSFVLTDEMAETFGRPIQGLNKTNRSATKQINATAPRRASLLRRLCLLHFLQFSADTRPDIFGFSPAILSSARRKGRKAARVRARPAGRAGPVRL